MKSTKSVGKMRAVVYCRVATESQLDGIEMKHQSAYLTQQAERNGFDVVGEVQAYEKGLTLDRSGWKTALNLCADKRATILVVSGISRVARGLPLAVEALRTLDTHGVMLYTCNGELPFPYEVCRLLM